MKKISSLITNILLTVIAILMLTAFQSNQQVILKVTNLPTSCNNSSRLYYLTTGNPGLYQCASGVYQRVGSSGGPNGSSLTSRTATATINGAAGATISATNIIPAGSIVMGVTVRVLTTFSNASLTSFTIGDGTTANLFGNNVALTAGTTTSYADHLSTFNEPVYKTTASVVLTGVGANFAANGSAEVVVFYKTLTPPSS